MVIASAYTFPQILVLTLDGVRPAVRQRYLDTPSKYLNDRFMNVLSTKGLRFVWPYSASSAVTISSTTGLLCLSDEFLLRANNLRSFTMASDFFYIYPEFRGDTPQFEPSPTYHRPESLEYLEGLYWSILRERARERLTQSDAVPPEQTSEVLIETQTGNLVHNALVMRHLPDPHPR